MTTLGTMIDQLIYMAGVGIKAESGEFTLDSSTTFTVVDVLRNSASYSNNTKLGAYVLRPQAATAADYIRVITSLNPAAGQATVNATWADTTATSETLYILPAWLNPRRLIQPANFALEKLYVANIEPISGKPITTGLADAGFQSSATTYYTASGTTFSKISTANSERVWQGLGSARTLNAGYIMQQHAAFPGEPVNVFAAASVAVGSGSLVLRDATASAAIGTTVTSTYRDYSWLVRQETVPAGCTLIEPRFTVVGTSDDVYWGAQCTLFPDRSRAYLDTKWDSDFKATRLVSARMGGQTPTTGVYPANAGDWETIPATDYSLTFERAGPNPAVINWHNNAQRHWYQRPVFIEGRRALADFTTALTLASWATDVIGVDKDLWDAQTRLMLFSMDDILTADPGNQRRLARANFDLQAIASQFRQTGPSRGRNFGNWGVAPS